MLVISVLANLVLGLVLLHYTKTPPPSQESREVLECGAIPIELILGDPACADKLRRALNVTKVRILHAPRCRQNHLSRQANRL